MILIGPILRWIVYTVVGVGCVAAWASAMTCMFRLRSALLDLLQDVNGKIPYVIRNDPYSMNPFLPFLVWRQHKEIFPQDTGARHRIKRYASIWAGSMILFVVVILVVVFA